MERQQASFQGGSGPGKSLEHSRHYQNHGRDQSMGAGDQSMGFPEPDLKGKDPSDLLFPKGPFWLPWRMDSGGEGMSKGRAHKAPHGTCQWLGPG